MERPKFLCDHMVGRLARWLRILGYDTIYLRTRTKLDLIREALTEGRITVTRDARLAESRGLRTLRLRSDHVEEQLAQLIRELHLDASPRLTRCVECNEELRLMAKATVKSRVPPFVFDRYDAFHECPACHRLYWPGTHVERMNAVLHEVTQETG